MLFRITLIEAVDQLLESRNYFRNWTAAKLTPGAVAAAVFGEGQVCKEFLERGIVDFGGLNEGAAWIGDAVDAAVFVVAERIAGGVLHVADEDVVPVAEVEGAVGCELVVDGAEVTVGGGEEVVAVSGLVAGFGVEDLMLFEAEEADGVSEDDVALDFVGEVAAGDEFEPGSGADALVFFENGRRFGAELSVVDFDGAGSHPVEVGVGSFEEEGLSEAVEGGAPGVGNGEAGSALEVVALRGVAEESAVGAADGAVGGFDVGMEKGAFAHVDGAGGIGAKGGDDVVGVVIVEAAEDDFADVYFVVVVGVLQEDEVVALGDVNSVVGDFESGGEVEIFGEDNFLVCFAIVVGVFVNEELVVWLGIAGSPMGVGGHGGDPEAALVVEGDLDRVGEVGEFFFGGEEFDFVAGCEGEGGNGIVAIEVFSGAVFTGRTVVGFDLGEGDGFGIGSGEIEGLALGGGPDRLVANGAHLFKFFEFGWVVLGAEGIVAATVDVDSVGDLIVFFPDPVFFEDGGLDFLVVF